MKRFSGFLFILTFFAVSASAELRPSLATPLLKLFSPPQEKSVILVLCYHDIVADGPDDPNATSDTHLSEFKAQLEYLKSEGYQTVSAEQYYAHRKDGLPLPAKALLLSFDDGYIGDYTYAFPILKAMDWKATFFVHTHYVGTTTTKVHMSWDQLREIDSLPLFKVYPHTVTHPNLTEVKNDQDLIAELRDSRDAVEKNLGGKRPFLAYPYGLYDDRVLLFTQDYYSMAFTLDDDTPIDTHKIYQENRLGINESIPDLEDFKKLISEYLGPDEGALKWAAPDVPLWKPSKSR